MIQFIGHLARNTPSVSNKEKCFKIDSLFTKNPHIQAIVVVDENLFPISLITRVNFYQKIGTLYGYNLYMGRSVELVANKNPVIVDYTVPIIEVCEMAMARKDHELYDDIIITERGRYKGTVRIKDLLMRFAEIQKEMATYMNPLTGLPGNKIIEEKLHEALSLKKFSVLYFDIDYFKPFNDTYGFAKGDLLLKHIATIFSSCLKNQFLGHIGGDDFIAILNHYDYASICENIIAKFDKSIKKYYSNEHLEQNYVIAENRFGEVEKIPLISLSIAVITNETTQFHSVEEISNRASKIKRLCKKVSGSCYKTES